MDNTLSSSLSSWATGARILAYVDTGVGIRTIRFLSYE